MGRALVGDAGENQVPCDACRYSERTLGRDHMYTLTSVGNPGLQLDDLGKLDFAEPCSAALSWDGSALWGAIAPARSGIGSVVGFIGRA